MTFKARQQLRQEVDLIGRFAETYRRKFSALIERLNTHPDSSADIASLRLCVEAVDMMLANQSELVRVLREMAEMSQQPSDFPQQSPLRKAA
ncbi:MAG TPA: hypothetical protein VH518_00165 [Tepidisphaeraceae bacterium]